MYFDAKDDGDRHFNVIRTTWYMRVLILGALCLHPIYSMATFVLDFCVITHSFPKCGCEAGKIIAKAEAH